jgi:hypothetical protein
VHRLLLLLLRRNNQPGVKKPVAFLAHGVTLASDSFAILNVNESNAFILADAGRDTIVFLEARVGTGSPKHQAYIHSQLCTQYVC